MFDAEYSFGGSNKLSKQVKSEILKHKNKEGESRLLAAAEVLQGIKRWHLSRQAGYEADRGLINQVNYAQSLVRKGLGVDIKYDPAVHCWYISISGVVGYCRLSGNDLLVRRFEI